jgi:hypothetical protein
MMYYTKTKFFTRSLVLFILGVLAILPANANASDELKAPDLPAQCFSIEVPAGNKVTMRTFAKGSQIYRWNGVTWDFVSPVANLYLEPKFFGEIGYHHAGPTWESKAGSKVVAKRVTGTGCTPDPTAIPWLLLESISSKGPGIFKSVSYIQRVKTTGGLAPIVPGTVVGEVVEVPYTAEYYFYRGHAWVN